MRTPIWRYIIALFVTAFAATVGLAVPAQAATATTVAVNSVAVSSDRLTVTANITVTGDPLGNSPNKVPGRWVTIQPNTGDARYEVCTSPNQAYIPDTPNYTRTVVLTCENPIAPGTYPFLLREQPIDQSKLLAGTTVTIPGANPDPPGNASCISRADVLEYERGVVAATLTWDSATRQLTGRVALNKPGKSLDSLPACEDLAFGVAANKVGPNYNGTGKWNKTAAPQTRLTDRVVFSVRKGETAASASVTVWSGVCWWIQADTNFGNPKVKGTNLAAKFIDDRKGPGCTTPPPVVTPPVVTPPVVTPPVVVKTPKVAVKAAPVYTPPTEDRGDEPGGMPLLPIGALLFIAAAAVGTGRKRSRSQS